MIYCNRSKKQTQRSLVCIYNIHLVHGAGTAAYELINEIKNLDIILPPVGGRGLLTG